MYCQACGKQIDDNSKFCGGCGAPQNATRVSPGFSTHTPGFEKHAPESGYSSRTPGAMLALSVIFGLFGGHAFYAGHVQVGIAKLAAFLVGIAFIVSLAISQWTLAAIQGVVLAACVVWNFVDIVIVVIGEYKDAEGKKIPKSD
jgi:hypothetical protein